MPAGGNSHPGQGFKNGHPPYYTGGSVPGHAPTNTTDLAHLNGPDGALTKLRNDPTSRAYAFRFDQPLGAAMRSRASGGRPKNKERECLEAIQNGTDLRRTKTRFPSMMVSRLKALHEVACDTEHKDFIQAQRLVREILTRQKGLRAGEEGHDGPAPATIEVIHGHVEMPLPGAHPLPGADPGESPAGAEVGNGTVPHATNGNGAK